MANVATKRVPLKGNKRSHAMNATKTTQKLNKQKTTINGKKVITTAREMKKAA